MSTFSAYRNKAYIARLADRIRSYAGPPVRFMEVCGGHTMAIRRFGIPDMLPASIELISGPGCPVCVSSTGFIDRAIELSSHKDTIITTFGDLIRVPGSHSSLEKQKAKGADIRVVLSSTDALSLARSNPGRKVIFLGIGFETTAPSTAVAIKNAQGQGISNFFVLSAHKVMPPAMEALIHDEVKIDGYLAPGHVSVITGSGIYDFIADRYRLPVVVSGFEPVDMLQSVYMLIRQLEENRPAVEIQYKRAVTRNGNAKARQFLEEVFEPADDYWRGLGILPKSGLQLAPSFKEHDAGQFLPDGMEGGREPAGCICGEVLKGISKPADCKLFATACHPANPIGACMVSAEGACHAWYKYQYEDDA